MNRPANPAQPAPAGARGSPAACLHIPHTTDDQPQIFLNNNVSDIRSPLPVYTLYNTDFQRTYLVNVTINKKIVVGLYK